MTSGARQRILETADRLFYEEGCRAVGIDRIIAEANVAKMTLYAHFPSKDDLILAVLKYREEAVAELFRSAMERHGHKTKSPLRAFFAALKEWFEAPGFVAAPSRMPRSNWRIRPTPALSLSVDRSSASASSCVVWSNSRSARGRQRSHLP